MDVIQRPIRASIVERLNEVLHAKARHSLSMVRRCIACSNSSGTRVVWLCAKVYHNIGLVWTRDAHVRNFIHVEWRASVEDRCSLFLIV